MLVINIIIINYTSKPNDLDCIRMGERRPNVLIESRKLSNSYSEHHCINSDYGLLLFIFVWTETSVICRKRKPIQKNPTNLEEYLKQKNPNNLKFGFAGTIFLESMEENPAISTC